MKVNFIAVDNKVSCGFMSENGQVFEGPGFNKFKVLLNELEFSPTTDIKLVHNTDVCSNIDSYDSRNSNKSLNRNIKETKKIDVSTNDINVGSTDLIFNFTDFNITVYNRYNIPHMLCPLETKALKDMYRGKIIFMTIHRFNNPAMVSDITGINKNYFKDLIEKNKYKKQVSDKFSDFCDVLEFADSCWDKIDYLSNDYKCNTIKIITIGQLPGESLMSADQRHPIGLFIRNKDLLISRESVFQSPDHPHINNEFNLSELRDKIIPGTRFVYIVDNDNAIGDRYHTVNGITEKVIKIQTEQKTLNGLYTAMFGSDFSYNIIDHVSIDDLDNVSFIYKTKEEAELGANKAELYKDELSRKEGLLRERELELKNMQITNKEEYERTVLVLRREVEELRAKSEAEALTAKTEYDKLKAKLEEKSKKSDIKLTKKKRKNEQKSMSEKTNYERWNYGMRSYYDDRKYSQDSFVETLKTGAAIAGVIATGFLIYSKVSKG